MGEKIQIFEANVDMSRAFRQFQMADKAFVNDKDDSAKKHLAKGLDLLKKVVGHLAKAAEDAYKKAGNQIDKGNAELQKSIDEYTDGNDNSGAKHYANALNYYDQALGLFD
jgi:hypothetical protein